MVVLQVFFFYDYSFVFWENAPDICMIDIISIILHRPKRASVCLRANH